VDEIIDWVELEAAATALQAAGAIDPQTVHGPDAVRLTEFFARTSRVCTAAETRFGARAVSCSMWKHSGSSGATDWFARTTGVSHREAGDMLATAERLERLPETARSFAAGELSGPQARTIARAAAGRPEAEAALLDTARRGRFKELERHCLAERARVTRAEDDAKRHERMHKERLVTFYTDASDGMACLLAKTAPEVMATVRLAMEGRAEHFFTQAKDGVHEPHGAYLADALVSLVTEGAAVGARPDDRPPIMLVRADLDALRRGYVEGDEVCEIPGAGEISVSAARELLGHSVLHLVLTEGTDIKTVCSLTRHVPGSLDIALKWRDSTCVIPGCDAAFRLERDHWPLQVEDDGPTTLENLVLACRKHHHDRHYRGFTLGGGPGRWTWTPPLPGGGGGTAQSAADPDRHGKPRDETRDSAPPDDDPPDDQRQVEPTNGQLFSGP
jgi:hypothetical protein